MTFFAVPRVLTAALAIVSMGRVGIRKYPPSAVPMWRKNMRRPSCGFCQKGTPCGRLRCELRTRDQSIPNRSFMTGFL